MDKKIINKYINQKKTDIKTLKEFCKEIFENNIVYEKNDYNVICKVLCFPSKLNGCYIKYSNKNDYHLVVINLFSNLFANKKSNICIIYFHLYVTLIHEIEHFRITNGLFKEFDDYAYMIATMEELISNNMWSFCFQIFRNRLLSKKKYVMSTTEILCSKKGYDMAYEKFEEVLGEQKESVLNICKSLKCLKDFFEIEYALNGLPYNKFTQNILFAQKKIKNNSNFIQKYPYLSVIFKENGKIKYIKEIYKELDSKNKELYNKILIYLFINLRIDLRKEFELDFEFKKYLEDLANEYLNQSMKYLDNIELMKIFLKEGEIQDNNKMIMKNIIYLNFCMKYYGMKYKSGTIIPTLDE